MITPEAYQEFVRAMVFDTAKAPEKGLIMGGLGLTGEAGEVADLIKKWVFHGREPDRAEILKELGDVEWYLNHLYNVIGTTRDEVQSLNVTKLSERHPRLAAKALPCEMCSFSGDYIPAGCDKCEVCDVLEAQRGRQG